MRRKTQIVLAIVFMVAALASFFSYVYISEILRQEITNADEIAAELTSQLGRLANNAVPDLTSTRVNTEFGEVSVGPRLSRALWPSPAL